MSSLTTNFYPARSSSGIAIGPMQTGVNTLKQYTTPGEQPKKGLVGNLLAKIIPGLGGGNLNSLVEEFYHASHLDTQIDNLGESWQDFKNALDRERYSLLPIFDKNNGQVLAFGVIEKYDINKSSNLHRNLALSGTSFKSLPKEIYIWDKTLTPGKSSIDMNNLDRELVSNFFANKPDSILLVPWRVNSSIPSLNKTEVPNFSHIAFSPRAGKITITTKHNLPGFDQYNNPLKFQSIFTKPDYHLTEANLKALAVVQAISEITAAEKRRFDNNQMSEIKSIIKENYAAIDHLVSKSAGSQTTFDKLLSIFTDIWKHLFSPKPLATAT